jgi:preprotein translocase subunit SecA
VLAAIGALGPELARAGDQELRDRAGALRGQALDGVPLETLLPPCFALVREIAGRVLGERPYDVQMLAGIALSRGRLVEMQTGEGKTLAAVAPVALNALTGQGVHVLTYNDYLARRDAGWMGPVYEQLGLTVGCVQGDLGTAERQRAYGCDITYLTVKEAGFDHLRDGLCLDPGGQVHRPFHLALVDEADSILIDEARIPLVIAGHLDQPGSDLQRLSALARDLQRGVHYDTDEYGRNIFLTDRGLHQAETALRCGDLHAAEIAGNVRLHAELRNALHAETLLRRDVDYIVRDGRIELVDELTGRIAENRHWPDGLQAALEAKEGLLPRPEGRVLGSVTIQHFLRKYPRLCGMTGTAQQAAGELARIYGLDVETVPSNRPSIRVDHPDVIYASKDAKRRALVEEITRVHATGRPMLVGTVSVEESERLAADLRQAGVACRVLNARNDAEEAGIVAEAGALGAVTISTNMAGRGTDIRLGGVGERQRDAVVALGGLYVLGTNRHESRRIDDQLRGRAGRQGDPGSSRFIISLEDPLLQRCGIERLLSPKLMQEVKTAGERGEEDRALDHPAVRREVARVQRIVEGQHGDLRYRLLSYWSLLEHQRGELREWRQAVLEGRDEESLLARQSGRRWSELCDRFGKELLRDIERRITLVMIDRCWSDHLTEMQAIRDEVHLVQLGGVDPFTHFYRTVEAAFEALLARIDDSIVEIFERVTVTESGVDWEREGLRGPSSTWTYLVNDNVFGDNTFLALANRPAFGLWAVLVCWWILLPWALVLHWRRWRQRREETLTPGPSPASGRGERVSSRKPGTP